MASLPPTVSGAPPTIARQRWSLLLGLLLMTAASLPLRGYSFGSSNHSVQVPLVEMYVDGSLFRFDLLRSSFGGYASLFFPLLAGLVRLTGHLEATYFVVYLAVQVAALGALFLLSRDLFDHAPSAVLTCLFYLAQIQSPSAETTHDSRLTHGELVIALLLWALLLYFRGRRTAAYALCGLAFDVHALYAGYVLVLFVADGVLRGRERGLRSVVVGLGVFLVLSLPALGWMIRDALLRPIGSIPEWLAVMRERSAVHAFPLSIPAAVYARYLLLLALGALALTVVPSAEWRRTVLHFGLAVAVLCAIGLLFSEWRPSSLIIRAQLLRSTKWLLLVLIVPMGRLLTVSREWGAVARLAAVLCATGLLVREPAWLALGLLLYLFAGVRRSPLALSVGVGACLVVSALARAAPLPEKLGLNAIGRDLKPFLANPTTVASAVLLALLVASSLRMDGRRLRIAQVAIGLATLLVVLPSFYRERQSIQQADTWTAVQKWAERNTPRDAVLLTPPYREGFRVFSKRAVVGEWKDGTQQFFSSAFAFEWRRRMAALGGGTPAYDDLDAERLRAIGREFGASYVVVRADRPLALPVLFSNDDYAVYRL